MLSRKPSLVRPRWPFQIDWTKPLTQGLRFAVPLPGIGAATQFSFSNGAPPLALTNNNSVSSKVFPGTINEAPTFASASSQSYSASQTTLTAVPITLACWFFPTAAQNEGIFGLHRSGNTTDLIDMIMANTQVVRARSNGNSASTTATATLNVWNHVCGVWAAITDRRVYLNGGNKATNATSTTPASIDTLNIGRVGGSSPAFFFSGGIADCRAYNRVLTDDEVFQLYEPRTRFNIYWRPNRRYYSFPAPASGSTYNDSMTLGTSAAMTEALVDTVVAALTLGVTAGDQESMVDVISPSVSLGASGAMADAAANVIPTALTAGAVAGDSGSESNVSTASQSLSAVAHDSESLVNTPTASLTAGAVAGDSGSESNAVAAGSSLGVSAGYTEATQVVVQVTATMAAIAAVVDDMQLLLATQSVSLGAVLSDLEEAATQAATKEISIALAMTADLVDAIQTVFVLASSLDASVSVTVDQRSAVAAAVVNAVTAAQDVAPQLQMVLATVEALAAGTDVSATLVSELSAQLEALAVMTTRLGVAGVDFFHVVQVLKEAWSRADVKDEHWTGSQKR